MKSFVFYKKLTRFFRTVYYLNPSQFFARLYCRSKFIIIEKIPGLYKIIFKFSYMRVKKKSKFSNYDSTELLKIISLLASYDKNTYEDYLAGSIYYLGRRIDFGAIDKINWNIDLNEKNNPLWLMTLSYFSLLIKLINSDDPKKLKNISNILKAFNKTVKLSTKGITRGIWHPYAASHRVINILATLIYLENEVNLIDNNSSLKNELIETAKENLVYVLLNLEYDLQYNHLLKNLIAIWLAKKYFEVPISDLKLRKLTLWSVQQNFLSDGGHSERSPMYHNLGLLDLMLLDQTLPEGKLKALVQKKITSSTQAAYGMSHINGDFAMFNDSWISGAPSIISITGSNSIPKQTYTNLQDTGYVKFLDKENSIVFDCGLAGPDNNLGHAHSDFLSYEYSYKGIKIISDYGTSTYSRGSRRDLSRSSMVHNGPAIIGYEPMECWDSFKVGSRPEVKKININLDEASNLYASAALHNGFRNIGVTVGRLICFLPQKGFFCTDIWVGDLKKYNLITNLLTSQDIEEKKSLNSTKLYFLNKNNELSPSLSINNELSFKLTNSEIYDDFEVSAPGKKIAISPKYISKDVAIAEHFFDFSICCSQSNLVYNKHVNSYQEDVKKYTSKLISEIKKYNKGK